MHCDAINYIDHVSRHVISVITAMYRCVDWYLVKFKAVWFLLIKMNERSFSQLLITEESALLVCSGLYNHKNYIIRTIINIIVVQF